MKIWRYMDLAKFTHMLATQSLYFACTTQMTDPYEGWLPRSHIAAMDGINASYINQLRNTCDTILAQPNFRGDPATLDAIVEDARQKLDFTKVNQEVNRKFGLNCWHINESESEAMWRLYATTGSGIAIESTKDRLRGLLTADGIIVDRVRYMDFEKDEIEKGHRHYGLFIKRNSFAHEQELRATILLPTPGIGTSVPCDMNALIVNIHIAPQAPLFYTDTVKYIVDRAGLGITAPVIRSTLLDDPSI
ncbi:hypothetical protein HDF16_000117 [Granulicella aggregans]|uniref:DUF2971 domain-containing protein n=1 Tax=Granulicella aggregans TaxID=474949 RepID=A0A7W7Z8W3_9BACT|nr:DUF2971 domain-containing protein [Granulicella aggregans]MBB5055448.1 hypothetical protein [Granulicella aggregans]